MQQDRLHGNCIAKASCQASAFDGVTINRKRRRHTDTKLRYVKRRFSPIKFEDVMAVGHPAPTHYLRVVFPPSRNWDVRSGHMLDDVQRWLAPYGAKPVTEYHITIALLICKPDQQFHNFSYLAHMLTDVVFELSDFHILGRTLVLSANECQHPNMTVHHIKEWLRVYGYTIYNSHLPLHLSVSKLHDLDDATRSYIGSTAYIKQYTTRILAKPTALELVTIRGTPNNPKQIVQSIPIF
nr:MAG: ORF4b protein [Middle East respiratory syndrome-related coronavirus]